MWTQQQKFDLIHEVREREWLWNPSLPNYSRKNAVERGWTSIADTLHVTAEDSKKEWRKLRTYYMNLKRQGKETHSGDGTDDTIPATQWPFFNQMKFIHSTLVSRSGVSNISVAKEISKSIDHSPSSPDLDWESADNPQPHDTEVQDLIPELFIKQPVATTSKTSEIPTFQHNRLTKSHREKERAQIQESKSTAELMETISISLKSKANDTGDEYFCAL